MNYAETGDLVRSRSSKSPMSTLCSQRNWRSAVAFPLDILAACSHLRVVSISIFIFVIYIFVGSLFVISLFVIFLFIFIVDFYGGAWDKVGFQKMVGSMFSPVIGTLDGGLSAALSAPLYPLLSLPWLAAYEIARPGGTDGCGH